MHVFLLCALIGVAFAWNKHMENPGLYQGDMVVTPDQLKAAKGGVAYAAQRGKAWRDGKIYYEMSPQIKSNKRAKQAVLDAIASYHSKTCIRFYERTTQSSYVYIIMGRGCYSSVGQRGGKQDVSLGQGCHSKPTAIHELMHAAGFWHEQMRPDRDQYITIKWENINSNTRYNFQKAKDVVSLGSPYDYRSIMHYRKDSFSNNGRVTMETKDRNYQDIIGRGTDLSAEDIKQLNAYYNCGGTKPNTPRPNTPKPWTPKPNTPKPDGNCKDTAINCHELRKFCNNAKLIPSCKKTCGKCGTPPTDCKDRFVNCHELTKYCSRPQIGPGCRKTCRKC